jgi:hypothetical protein
VHLCKEDDNWSLHPRPFLQGELQWISWNCVSKLFVCFLGGDKSMFLVGEHQNLSNKWAHIPALSYGDSTAKQYQLLQQQTRPHGLFDHGHPEPVRRLSSSSWHNNPPAVIHWWPQHHYR